MTEFTSPYHALAVMAEMSRQKASGLPQQEAFEQTWTGVGFRISGYAVVSPMSHVTELLTPPNVTYLPGVKSWVLGVANVRGRLVPVIDLCGFLGLTRQGPRQSQRVLLVEQGDILVGLLVEQVQGMQHFSVNDRTENTNTVPDALAEYVDGAYRKNKESWLMFSMERLLSQDKFMQVAA